MILIDVKKVFDKIGIGGLLPVFTYDNEHYTPSMKKRLAVSLGNQVGDYEILVEAKREEAHFVLRQHNSFARK
jgi:hypothetical protein